VAQGYGAGIAPPHVEQPEQPACTTPLAAAPGWVPTGGLEPESGICWLGASSTAGITVWASADPANQVATTKVAPAAQHGKRMALMEEDLSDITMLLGKLHH
jgi:hypothetical protein